MELFLQPGAAPIYPVAATQFVKTAQISPPAPTFQRRPPLALLDPAGTDLGRHIAAPRAVNRAPVLHHRVQSARQTGFRLVVDPNGWVALDDLLPTAEACEAQMRKFATHDNPFWAEDTDVRQVDGRFFSDRLDTPDAEVPGTTVSLLSVEPSNYGSFLFRVLAKLAVAQALGLGAERMACWCPRPYQKSLLAFFGVAEAQVLDVRFHRAYQFADLQVLTSPNPECFLNETTLDFVRATLKRHGIRQSRSRYIYISRVSHARRHEGRNIRHFVDEERLCALLAAGGFEIVEPETLGTTEQIALFAGAAMVVGASGAGMFNTIFCEAGTLIYDIEAFPYWLHAHANYFSSCGHNYVMAFGTPNSEDTSGPHRSWTIDTQAVAGHVFRLRDALA